MSSEEKEPIQLLQGTLDLIVLRTLASMGAQHAYQIANRLQQVSEKLLNLNQGTLYPVLLRFEQDGALASEWGSLEGNRLARFYRLTRVGQKLLDAEKRDWELTAAIISCFFVMKAEDLA